MNDKRSQQLGLVPQGHQGIPNMYAQFSYVGWRQVAQATILGPAPNAFVGVGVGSMRRKVLDFDFRMILQPRSYDQRLAMNLVLVPNHRPPAAHFTFELPQKQ